MSRLVRHCLPRAAALAAVAGVVLHLRAEPSFPSTSVLKPGEYFDEVLVGKPNGVYENGDRLFALARVQQEDSPFRSKAAASAAAARELRKWAVARCDEASPHFPKEPGLVAVLRLHRKYFSGDNAAWLWHSSSSQSFQNDGDEEYVFALCVPKKDILASLPVPGTGDGLPGNWSDYLRSLVMRRYVRAEDSEFLLDCGAPDAVLARETLRVSRAFAEASATNALPLVGIFLASEAQRNPFGGTFATKESFEAVQRQLASDLPASWVAASIRERSAAFASLLAASSNTVTAVATNATAVSTNNMPVAEASSGATNAPPAVLDAERMFLTAGRFACPADSGAEASDLARQAFQTKGGLAGKRATLWSLLCDRPGIADAWNYLGRILREEGSAPSAIACFRCALRLKPDHEFAWANLALAYHDLGKSDLAVATALIARGLATDPWSVRETEAILSAPAAIEKTKP